jgi:hypothetical protein
LRSFVGGIQLEAASQGLDGLLLPTELSICGSESKVRPSEARFDLHRLVEHPSRVVELPRPE